MQNSTGSPVVLFAIKSTQQLQNIAHELAQPSQANIFSDSFETELTNIQLGLEIQQNNASQLSGSARSRIFQLLDRLENFCQGSKQRAVRPIPTGNTFDKHRYPALSELRTLKGKRRVETAIKRFSVDANRMQKHKEFLTTLSGTFGKSTSTMDIPDFSDLSANDALKRRNDYQAYIQELHKTLVSHCVCPNKDGQTPITANLSLNGYCLQEQSAENVAFRLFFLDHPHEHGDHGSCQWQDANVHVPRSKMVKVISSDAETDEDIHDTIVPIEAFCETITGRQRLQLKFKIADGSLILQSPCSVSEGYDLGLPSVSLANLLKGAHLSQKMKTLLSYFLIKAVWQFYDSPWMHKEWNKTQIHFMFGANSNSTTEVLINEPFLSANFNNDHPIHSDEKIKSHPFPKLSALGIMLLEIELGIWIEEEARPEDLGSHGAPLAVTNYIVAKRLFNETEWGRRDTFGPLKNVIDMCLMPKELEGFQYDTEGLRASIEELFINPLQHIYEIAWIEDPDKSCLHEIIYEAPSPGSHVKTETIPTLSSEQSKQSKEFLASQELSKKWFAKLGLFNTLLRPLSHDTDERYRPVRIAILDTGIHESSADLIEAYKDFIKNSKSDGKGVRKAPADSAQGDAGSTDGSHDTVSVEEQSEMNYKDNTGHGTNAVHLITKACRHAKIYVGRVFEHSYEDAATPEYMASAIKHAQDCWQADLIVIPSGFMSEHADIETAIENARNARILTFAAASNYGNRVDIGFPARLYRDLKLFCMFSTDAMVRAQPQFNPSGHSDARYNFAIFGENVFSQESDIPLSGTSYATMIGAAVAARLLDFSRHKESRDKIRNVHKLTTVEGMSEVFAAMARDGIDNNYHCMAPWKIIPPCEIADKDEQRAICRSDICETISRALARR